MSIQLASFLGANIFTAKDAPRYRRPLIIGASTAFGAAAIALLWKALYRWVSRLGGADAAGSSDNESIQKGETIEDSRTGNIVEYSR